MVVEQRSFETIEQLNSYLKWHNIKREDVISVNRTSNNFWDLFYWDRQF